MNDQPLVRIDTADDAVPLIIERPDSFPFNSGEREQYRTATTDEYRRYTEHYNRQIPGTD